MPTQAPEIDGVTLINDFEGDEPRPGEIRRLRITEAHDYDLVGTLLAVRAETARRTFASRATRSKLPYDEVSDLQERKSNLGDPEFPFCSERCRLIDLGNWASEKYVISTPGEPEARARRGR